MTSQHEPTLTVVVPAYQAESTLPQCLAAMRAAGVSPEEICVVDDRSTDGTRAVAEAAGVQVMTVVEGKGASTARNLGARAARGDVIVFVDADVTVHPDARALLLASFREDADLDALFGSYDAAPAAPGTVSRYRNLLHHFVHQRAPARAYTFWTGLGAVRRNVFMNSGGFDASTEDIEDVDFGLRLSGRGGQIRLERRLLGTHLKQWTLASMVRTDFFGRALPWTRLLLRREGMRADLNTGPLHRLRAVVALCTVAALFASPLLPTSLGWAMGGLLLFVALDAAFFRLLLRCGGAPLLVGGVGLHLIHYLTALGGFGYVCLFEELPRRVRGRLRARRE